MGEKKGIWRYLNLFDIVAIVVIVALACVFVLLERQSAAAEETDTGSGTVTYVVEFMAMENGSEAFIQPGDRLVDKVKKYEMGNVVSVEITDAREQTHNFEEGSMTEAVRTTGKDAYVTVRAACTETDRAITVGGGFTVRVGKRVSVRGPGYFGTGYIVDVVRGDDA